jgi:xanthine dehydrogenase accessory factor
MEYRRGGASGSRPLAQRRKREQYAAMTGLPDSFPAAGFLSALRGWRDADVAAMVVRVAGTKGSAPRDAGAIMGVTGNATAGTIGGGQLEWLAIAHARKLLPEGDATIRDVLDIALGPEIGQCCGGRSILEFERLDTNLLLRLEQSARREADGFPQVHIFGAGHTGLALCRALLPLPVRAILVDPRAEALAAGAGLAKTVHAAVPEEVARNAPAGSAFVAMTHEHHLDFLVMAEALKRRDAAYCGMIGSKTKRAVFASWLEDAGQPRPLAERLTCPIGGKVVRDKRPETIAAMTAAEILTAFHSPTR